MEQYVYFDDDVEYSTAVNTNSTSSAFYGQSNEIRTCSKKNKRTLNAIKPDDSSMNKPDSSNMNEPDTSTMNELYVLNSQNNGALSDQFNDNDNDSLEECDDEMLDRSNRATDERCKDEEISLIWRSPAVPVMISTTKKALQKRNIYTVNNEDNEIIDILQSYILRNKGEKNAHSNDTQAKNKAKRPLQLTEVNINAVDKNQEILEEMTTNSSDEDSYSNKENNIQ
ncbi:19146_t:CDS:2, partial [Gigaspora margarita]